MDRAVAIDHKGKVSYVNNKLLVDIGVLLPSGIVISENLLFSNPGGNSSQIKPLELRNANGATVNLTMQTLGQVEVRIKLSNISHIFFRFCCYIKKFIHSNYIRDKIS